MSKAPKASKASKKGTPAERRNYLAQNPNIDFRAFLKHFKVSQRTFQSDKSAVKKQKAPPKANTLQPSIEAQTIPIQPTQTPVQDDFIAEQQAFLAEMQAKTKRELGETQAKSSYLNREDDSQLEIDEEVAEKIGEEENDFDFEADNFEEEDFEEEDFDFDAGSSLENEDDFEGEGGEGDFQNDYLAGIINDLSLDYINDIDKYVFSTLYKKTKFDDIDALVLQEKELPKELTRHITPEQKATTYRKLGEYKEYINDFVPITPKEGKALKTALKQKLDEFDFSNVSAGASLSAVLVTIAAKRIVPMLPEIIGLLAENLEPLIDKFIRFIKGETGEAATDK